MQRRRKKSIKWISRLQGRWDRRLSVAARAWKETQNNISSSSIHLGKIFILHWSEDNSHFRSDSTPALSQLVMFAGLDMKDELQTLWVTLLLIALNVVQCFMCVHLLEKNEARLLNSVNQEPLCTAVLQVQAHVCIPLCCGNKQRWRICKCCCRQMEVLFGSAYSSVWQTSEGRSTALELCEWSRKCSSCGRCCIVNARPSMNNDEE